jgi:hypothetical protein
LVGRVRDVSDAARQAPVVTTSQILAAGFAAAVAAVVTSRFGVAGTLIGSALTAMIITGGSAILKAYLESVTGNVRKVPSKLREQRNRRRREGGSAEPDTMPGRPDLRDNFAGRVRAALDWFSRLPPLARRSILVKGLIAAAVAFVIGMGAVFAVERGIGNSLSCGLWAKCPEGAKPGIHLGESRGTGAGSTLSLGRARTQAAPGYERQRPAYQQPGVQQNGVQQNRSYQQQQQQAPDSQQPARPNNEPGRGVLEPEKPVDKPEVPPQPEPPPNSASPDPGDGGPKDGASPPPRAPRDKSRASPAPSQ